MEVVLAVNHSETVLELKSEISLLSSELEKLLDVFCHESHEVGCQTEDKIPNTYTVGCQTINGSFQCKDVQCQVDWSY